KMILGWRRPGKVFQCRHSFKISILSGGDFFSSTRGEPMKRLFPAIIAAVFPLRPLLERLLLLKYFPNIDKTNNKTNN
ncbi:MAG TPA: hypothetical protein PLH83_14225, partial [Ruminococcus sp.]|nr:hypothetical protein [Ruminococcus sp.]